MNQSRLSLVFNSATLAERLASKLIFRSLARFFADDRESVADYTTINKLANMAPANTRAIYQTTYIKKAPPRQNSRDDESLALVSQWEPMICSAAH